MSDFELEVKAIAGRVGIPEYRWILAVMQHESHTNPQAVNPISGATGLIQFTGSTACGLLGVKPDGHNKSGNPWWTEAHRKDALARVFAMTAMEQLQLVEKYLATYKGRYHTASDVAAAVFQPSCIGDAGHVVAVKGTDAYKGNARLDREGKGFITIVDYMRSLRPFGLRFGVEMSDVDGYLTLARKASTWEDLINLNTRMMVENPKNKEALAVLPKFNATLAKAGDKNGMRSAPVWDSVDYRDLAVSKIRGAFRVQSEYSPSVQDYVETAVQTAQDIGNKAVEVASSLPSLAVPAIGAAVAAGALALFLKLRR